MDLIKFMFTSRGIRLTMVMTIMLLNISAVILYHTNEAAYAVISIAVVSVLLISQFQKYPLQTTNFHRHDKDGNCINISGHPKTINKALKLLEEEGWIEREKPMD